jgi:hypothetical protein
MSSRIYETKTAAHTVREHFRLPVAQAIPSAIIWSICSNGYFYRH